MPPYIRLTAAERKAKRQKAAERAAARTDLSTDPKQVRNRLRRAARATTKHQSATAKARIERDLKLLGYKPVEDWDMEELAHGRVRDKRGGFGGRAPMWLTDKVRQEAKKRLADKTYSKLTGKVEKAVKLVYDLITNDEVDDKGRPVVDARTKLAAAQFIIEHVIGKPQANINLNATEDFVRSALVPAIVLDDGQPQDAPVKMIEGSVVEVDEAGEDMITDVE